MSLLPKPSLAIVFMCSRLNTSTISADGGPTLKHRDKLYPRYLLLCFHWNRCDRVVTLAEADKTIAGLRDASLIRLMSDCLLRISETVAVNVGDIQKSTLRIRSSKTDQEGRGEVLYVGGPTLRLIDRYCTRAEIQTGALFRHIRRGDHVQSGRLTTVSARRIIQARAKAATQDRQRCLTHTGGRGFGGRYAERWQVEVSSNAGALWEGGDRGTGDYDSVLL